MAELKYSQYFLTDAGKATSPAIRPAVLEGIKDWGGIQHRINWRYISQPVELESEPHSHDFDEFLCFLGNDPANPEKFGAEIEISMGEESEKNTINTASVVCIPKGIFHCPLKVTKVNEPILFCNIYLAPEYTRNKLSR